MSEEIVSFDKEKFAADQAKLRAKFVKAQSRKIYNSAIRAGAKFLQKRAKENAPVGKNYDRKSERASRVAGKSEQLYHKKGTLKRSIRVMVGKFKKRGEISYLVATGRRDKMGIPQDAKHYYPAVVEYGPKKRASWPGRFYMKRTYQSHGAQVIAMVREEIKTKLEALGT